MNYATVRVSTLRGDQKINFNIFIKLQDKMILYLKEGDSFDGVRLKKLKEKKLSKMFILKDDEKNYLKYLQNNIDSAYDLTSQKDLKSRVEIIQGVQQNNTEELLENIANQESYNKAKADTEKYIQFIMKSPDSVGAMVAIENTDQNIAQHGTSVSTLAIALAHRLGITDPKKLQLLALGALIHDYGHTFHPLELSKPIKDLSPDQLEIWNKHASLGAEKVQDKGHFDINVLNIMNQHEEKIDGSGPLKMFENKQDPLATIVSSANTVDRLISFEKMNRSDIPKNLILNYLGQHPLQHMQILGEMIK